MTGFNHTLAGCIIAVIVPAPLAPFVAFASHFVLDATPHFGRSHRFVPYNKDFIRFLVVDGLLCVAALVFSISRFPHLWWLMIICAAAATLPDFMWLLKHRVKWLNGFFRFAHWIQWGERPWAWIFDLAYGMIFVTILLKLS